MRQPYPNPNPNPNPNPKVMQHIEATWKRGAEVVAMVRAALGARADELVPLIHGGVHISKLNGSMHDTCNTANLVAKKVL